MSIYLKDQSSGKVESGSVTLQGEARFSGVDHIAPILANSTVTRNVCSPVYLVMRNEGKQQVAQNPFNRPMPITLSVSAGSKLYGDAGCTQEISVAQMPSDKTQVTIWLKASEGAQLTISATMITGTEK